MGLAVVILVALLAIFFIRRRKSSRAVSAPPQTSTTEEVKYQPANDGRFHEMGTPHTYAEMPTSATSRPHELWAQPMELQGDSRR